MRNNLEIQQECFPDMRRASQQCGKKKKKKKERKEKQTGHEMSHKHQSSFQPRGGVDK